MRRMGMGCCLVVLAAALLLAAATPHASVQQETATSSPTDQELVIGGNLTGREDAPTAGPNLTDFLLMLFWLGVVVAIIVAGFYVVRRCWPSVIPVRAGGVQVLGRSYIGPKQSVVLLKVGSKVLVVGVSAQNMTTLAEINDPSEIAELGFKETGKTGRMGSCAAGRRAETSQDHDSSNSASL